MMLLRVSVILLGLLAGFSSVGHSQDTPSLSTIEVLGRARLFVEPNQATVSFAVETRASSAADSIRDNADQMKKFLETLRGVMQKDDVLTTTGFRLSPIYERGERTRPRSYLVKNTVLLKTKSLDRLGLYIDEVSSQGVTRIGNLTFSHDQEHALKKKAALKALQNAMADAEALAKEAGLSIERVAKIRYDSADRRRPTPSPPANVLGGAETAIAPKEITITSVVEVVFVVQ
jgi:hypothetical protein